MKCYLSVKPCITLLSICYLLFMGSLIPLWAQTGPANPKTVLVIGTAVSADAAKAKDLAVSNGLVSAVSQAADELLPENGLAKYFQEISQTVLIDTEPYIREYQVTAEASAGNVYRVVLKATVSMDALKRHLEDAGFIRSYKGLPKILFLLSEKSVVDAVPRYWWRHADGGVDEGRVERVIKEILTNASYEIINHRGISMPDSLRGKSILSDPEALQIGRNSIAEAILIGEATVEMASNIMGTDKRTFNGVVHVRALRSDSGELLAEVREEAVILDSNPVKGSEEALTQAGILAGNAITTQLAAKWQATDDRTEQLTLRVEGISDLASFVKFRKTLKTMPGVNSMYVIEMQADEASILVDYEGGSEALAEALMLNTYDRFGINIYDVTAEQLKIKLIKE